MADLTYDELFAMQTPESQQRILAMAEEMRIEMGLHQLREELNISQKELAETLGVSQPAVVAMEKRGKDIKLSSIKRYVEAMGGKLNLAVSLPTGKTVSFQI